MRTVGGGELGGRVCRFPQEDWQRHISFLDLGVVGGPELTARARRGAAIVQESGDTTAHREVLEGAHRMPLLPADDWQSETLSSMSALEAWKLIAPTAHLEQRGRVVGGAEMSSERRAEACLLVDDVLWPFPRFTPLLSPPQLQASSLKTGAEGG